MLAKANDPDIEATSINMSLKDPISMLRMTIPCRSNVCTHNQCFDAFTFLDMQQQGPTWTCPICSKPVQYEGLSIDEYVQEILQKMPQSVDQVTLEPNGTWKPVVEDFSNSNRNGRSYADDDDDDDLIEISDYRPAGLKAETPATPSFGMTTPMHTPGSNSGNRANGMGGAGTKRKSEVIDLTLSDDDDAPPAKRPATTASAASNIPDAMRNGYRQSVGAPAAAKTGQPASYSFTLQRPPNWSESVSPKSQPPRPPGMAQQQPPPPPQASSSTSQTR